MRNLSGVRVQAPSGALPTGFQHLSGAKQVHRGTLAANKVQHITRAHFSLDNSNFYSLARNIFYLRKIFFFFLCHEKKKKKPLQFLFIALTLEMTTKPIPHYQVASLKPLFIEHSKSIISIISFVT